MKTSSNKQLRRTILCAIFAGALAAPFAAQTAYALPIEGANAAANKTEADISTSGAVMDIAGKTDHNILKWEDFSVEQGEKVRFDNGAQTKDYLNLVTGEGASNIYGTIEGGRNVYLVNPHGILFAKGSEVNTGALYLSTANPADIAAATNTFKADGTSPLSATAQTGDVLNLGAVKAAKLYIEGKNVTVLNTDAVTDTNGTALTGSAVTIRSEETPHIGYDVVNTTSRNFTVNGVTSSKTVSDYANANNSKSATSRTWVVTNLSGTAHTDYDYMRVHDVYELQNMNAKLDGRYMLADDIAANETKNWTEGFQPIGDMTMSFRGRFDGVGHTITGLTINPLDDPPGEFSRGMFAFIQHAHIENVSLKGASVSGTERVGGIVGYAEESAIRNVSFSGEVHGDNSKFTVGGIAGTLAQSTLENAYNEGTVEGNKTVGGIVGYVSNHSTVQNVRNAGKVLGNAEFLGGIAGTLYESTLENAYNEGTVKGKKIVGGIAGALDNSTLQNAWNTGAVTGNGNVGGIAGSVASSSVRNAVQTGDVEQRAGQTDSQVGGVVGLLQRSTLSHAVWKEGSVKAGSGAPIRKGVGETQVNPTVSDVEERSLDDMKKAATYAEWKDGSGKALVATEGGKGTPWRIYDGKTMPLLKAFLKTKHLANREKVYDGTAPTIAGGDHISLDAEKNVGTYHAYSEQYDIIGGAYKVVPKELTLGFTNGTRFDKTYDGNANVTQTLTKGQHYGLTGFVGNEGADVELAGAVTGTYADKNAGKNKEVTFQNLALTGTGAGNYTIKKAQGVGTIAPKELTLDLVGGTRFDKTYDRNVNVTQSLTKGGNYTLTGFITGEGNGIALASSTGTYSDKNAATDKTVTFHGLTLTGTGAGNYTLDKTTLTGIGTIARRALTLGAVAGQTKIYNGTTDADTSKFHAALNNVVAGEENSVTATATGATYNSKDVATAGTVGYTGVALAGAEAGNYTLAATTAQGSGSITRRALTVATVAAQSKIYDGNTAADTSKFQATLGNLVTGEENSVTATAGGATYNDKNVAAANKVTYTGVQLTGAGAANYSIASTAQGAGGITAKQLNLALANGARFDKTYDGNANVTQALAKGGNYTLTGFVGTEGDHLALAATGTYTDKNAATDKTVTFGGLTLTGAGAGNYALDKTALTGIGTIARRELTLGEVGAQTKTYDGTRAANASKFHAALNSAVAGDDVTAAAATATFNDKNVARANRIDYTGVALAGADAGNYSLAATAAQGDGTITRRTLTLGTVTAQTKTYDGTTSAKASEFRAGLNNVVAGEENSVTATAAGAAYNDKNVAGASKVNYTGVALIGAGAGNYTIAETAQGAGTITKRALTLGEVAAQTKTYDGTTAADASKFHAALNNVVAGDNVTAAATTATFNDKNVAAANRIDYTGVALSGVDAGNYSIAATTAQGAGTITRRTLTVGAVTAQTKTYDGTTAADAAAFRATLGNLVTGEESSVTATATGAAYNSKDVAQANAVSYTGVSLTGTGAVNYTVANTAEGAGTITKRTLTVGSVTAQTKTYDGTTAADAAAFRATLGNLVAGEENSVAATAAGAAYNDKNVAGANTVSYTGVALTGTGAGNYAVADTAQGVGTITKRALTLGEVTAQTKTYDGTTAADTSKFRAALGNTVAGDNVTAAAATATFNDKNVAAANRIDYTGVALAGADAGNYTLAATMAQGAGLITWRTLTFGTVAAQTKIYDGNTSADAAKFRATLAGFVAGEEGSATATAAGAAYNDKNVARANAVSYTGVALQGAGAANYTIADTVQGAGAIAKRALTLGAVAAQSKTYDGTTAAAASKFRATLGNVVAGEENSVTATAAGASYNDKNVAGANKVNYTGIALKGTGAGNYAVADTAQGAGSITPRDLTLTADAKTITQGEPLPAFTGKAQGFADGEDGSVFGADGVTFTTAVADTNTPGSYAIIGKAGGVTDGVLGNYRIRQAADNATAFTVNAVPTAGGILAALVQDAAPRFDFGFGDAAYLYGTARPIRAATLGLYRFDAKTDLENRGMRL